MGSVVILPCNFSKYAETDSSGLETDADVLWQDSIKHRIGFIGLKMGALAMCRPQNPAVRLTREPRWCQKMWSVGLKIIDAMARDQTQTRARPMNLMADHISLELCKKKGSSFYP